MPVFHPTLPSMAFKTIYRGDLGARITHPEPPSLTASTPLPGAPADDIAVAPAAPPSAVQMQIEALISEQVLSREAEEQAQSDA